MTDARPGIRRAAPWAVVLVAALATAAHARDAVPDSLVDPNPTRLEIVPRQDRSATRQLADERACYRQACEQTDWDPYAAYAELADAGYAVALTREDLESGLILAAAEGAEVGTVAGEIAGAPRAGEEIGIAVVLAREVLRTQYLVDEDDPEARRKVDRFERDLRRWERRFAACLRPRGYRVTLP